MNSSKKGYFITVEGCEGAGKSTQVKILEQYFNSRGIDALFTREPGGTKIGEAVRGIILDSRFNDMSDLTELLLYEAARSQHVENVIKPALSRGAIVVCDRFIHSTLAYQGYARGMDIKLIESLNAVACGGLCIDLCLFMDISPADGFIRKGGADGDRLESMDLDFHTKVYEGFLEMAARDKRIAAVDANSDKNDIHKKILGILKARGIVD